MEQANADEWDIHRRQQRAARREDSGWQEVPAKPNKGKQRQTDNIPEESERKSTIKGQRDGRFARRWEQSNKGRAPQSRGQRKKPKLIDIDANDDDSAQAHWRDREPPRAAVRIPGELVLGDSGNLYHLAKQHHCFVTTTTDQRPTNNGESVPFGIWGKASDAEKVRRAIHSWIKEAVGSQKSARSAKFAKLASMTTVLRQRAENRWKREVQRQKYRQHPRPDMAFGAIGTFHWPVKEYSPQEILGTNYEALDAIRMDCSCYVVRKKNSFQVMGKNMEKVKAAVLRLRQTVFQIAAKQLPPQKMYLLHWPKGIRPDTVVLEEYERPRQLSGPSADESTQYPIPRGEGSRFEDESYASVQTRVSEKRTCESIKKTLDKLPFYRGSIRMRFHFGRFLATQYMLPDNGQYALEDYESMIKESQFEGLTTNELGDREMEQGALSSLRDADGILIPLDPTTHKLSCVKPVYTAVFKFVDMQGMLCLAKSWQAAEEHDSKTTPYESLSQKWTRLDRETGESSSLVDISLTDLTTSFGWAFTVEAAQAVDEERIDPALVNFAYNLKVDADAALRQAIDKPFVKFSSFIPNSSLKSVEQRITYSFGMRDFDYNVELTRSQLSVYPGRSAGSFARSSTSSASGTKIFEPRWGVTVHRVDWDTMSAENEQLSVGEKTSWSDKRWFPAAFGGDDNETENSSFSGLMVKLNELGDVLRAARVEDLMGGMSIG